MATGQSKASMLTDSVDWVTKGGAAKYGNIDTTKIAAAGQSCGGLEAFSASYHDDRIKRTVLFNSGVVDAKKKYLLKELKAPVAYFTGRKLDGAQANVSSPSNSRAHGD
jgi:dienelactone hydrolase